ncbi:hypothetical protein AM493_08930 [Flavobacterium akiainvivens]|uniref:DUF5640 domain-containing protein n=1 Tax=Flavobacterium akiainvivens TaxID=1202724 RepID=A0A0M8MH62_9FLAO|nr:hypothetical protein [Flavobacterium akiainvivens]KOS06141.1 hypothetical protein AM493_08930 [Flavobacterium akiainvivens]SFQ67868.1 hypothetical protein SAMN05444144_11420 [Flavobacterium akiainvivens]
MKHVIMLFLLATMPVLAQKDFKSVGKWQGTDDDGGAVYITFDAEGYVTMQKGDEIVGGKHFEMEGIEGQMTYKFIDGTNQLDFIMKELSSGQENTLMGIYKVNNPDEIVLAMNNLERPEDFTVDPIVFKRVKK